MKRLVLGLMLGLLAGSVGHASAPALAAPNDAPSVTFNTAFAPQYYGAGEYDGILHLTFGPHGYVNGWYRPVDVGVPHSVTGGLTGKKLWLDLGDAGLHNIQATYDGDKIVGGTYFGNQVYSFVATPTTQRL